MIFTISFIGSDLKALLTQPVRTAIVVGIVILLWIIGKQIEYRINQKVEADFEKLQGNVRINNMIQIIPSSLSTCTIERKGDGFFL